MRRRRVVQFGTGFVGHFALRAIIEHPDLELAGVWVHSPEKVGLDASDIAGTAATGIVAANDLEDRGARDPAATRICARLAAGRVRGRLVAVEGDPELRCHVTCTSRDGDHHSGGILATGTRLVTAISAVCAAPPGAIASLEPLLPGRNLYRVP